MRELKLPTLKVFNKQRSFLESLRASVTVLIHSINKNVVETSPHKILLCQEKNNYTGKISMVSNYEIQAYVTSILLTEPVSTSKLKWCNWKVVSTLQAYCAIYFPLLCGLPCLFSYSYWAYLNNLQSEKSIIFATKTYNLELIFILLYL